MEKNTTEPNANMLQRPLSPQLNSSLDGRVAILWDIENCAVPRGVLPEDVAGNIRMALRVHLVIREAVIMFSAYGDFNAIHRQVREGLHRTGVKLIDVPNGTKDAADKAILVDMFLFAFDNPPPSSIMLISGDVDFAPALHILGQRGYTVIVVIPAGVGVSSALRNAGKFVLDWQSVARGALVPPRGGSVGYLTGCRINDNSDGKNEEGAIVHGGMSHSYYNSGEFSVVSQSLPEYNGGTSNMSCLPTTVRSHSLPSGLNDASGGPMPYSDHNECPLWVKPGDLNGLKGQLVTLLEISGGYLPLARVAAEYQKTYGRPLYVAEYGAMKLVNLFKKMGDTMTVEGKGHDKIVSLGNSKAGPSAHPLSLAKKDKKGKGGLEKNADVVTGSCPSDEFSVEDRLVIEELDERSCTPKGNQVRSCPSDEFSVEHRLVIEELDERSCTPKGNQVRSCPQELRSVTPFPSSAHHGIYTQESRSCYFVTFKSWSLVIMIVNFLEFFLFFYFMF